MQTVCCKSVKKRFLKPSRIHMLNYFFVMDDWVPSFKIKINACHIIIHNEFIFLCWKCYIFYYPLYYLMCLQYLVFLKYRVIKVDFYYYFKSIKDGFGGNHFLFQIWSELKFYTKKVKKKVTLLLKKKPLKVSMNNWTFKYFRPLKQNRFFFTLERPW